MEALSAILVKKTKNKTVANINIFLGFLSPNSDAAPAVWNHDVQYNLICVYMVMWKADILNILSL